MEVFQMPILGVTNKPSKDKFSNIEYTMKRIGL